MAGSSPIFRSGYSHMRGDFEGIEKYEEREFPRPLSALDHFTDLPRLLATEQRSMDQDLKAFQSLVATPSRALAMSFSVTESSGGLWRRFSDFIAAGLQRWKSAPAPFLLMAFGGWLEKRPSTLLEYRDEDSEMPILLEEGQARDFGSGEFPENLQLREAHAQIRLEKGRYQLLARDLSAPVYYLKDNQWLRVYPSEPLDLETGSVVTLGIPPTRAERDGFDPSRTTLLRWQEPRLRMRGRFAQIGHEQSAKLTQENKIFSETLAYLRGRLRSWSVLARGLGWTDLQRDLFLRSLAASPIFILPPGDLGSNYLKTVTRRFQVLLKAMKDNGELSPEQSLAWAQFFAGGVFEANASSVSYLGIVLNGLDRLHMSAEAAMSFIDGLGANRRSFDNTSILQLDTFGYLLGHGIPSEIARGFLEKYQAIVKDNPGEVYLYLGPTFIALQAGGYRAEQAIDLLVYLAEKAHWSEAEMMERALWMSDRSEEKNDESDWLASVHRELRLRYGLQRIFKQVEWIQQVLHQGFVTTATQIRLFETVADVLGRDASDGFHAVIQVLSAVAPGAKDLESQVLRMIADLEKEIPN